MEAHASVRYLAQQTMPDGTERTLYRYPNGYGARLHVVTADRCVMTVIKWHGDFWSADGSAGTAGLAHPVGEAFDVPRKPDQAFRFLMGTLREVWEMPAPLAPDMSGQWQAYVPD